jgi:dephospho-CoA kinase
MFVVGLSGGIGSGKTAASNHFEQLGISVIDADIAARVVVEPGQVALEKIARHFGADILLADGSLNRAALRKTIFSDIDAKQWLESLLHPLINEEISNGLATANSAYAVFVSPLLLESQQRMLCDQLLIIDVPKQLQIERTMQRDSNDIEQVKRIIASQIPRQKRLGMADDVIENTAGLEQLQQQVDILHQKYLRLAQDKIVGAQQQ